MTERYPMETGNFGNASQEEDPIILAASYTMYKIGEVFNQFYFPVLIPVGIIGNILSFMVMVQPHNRGISFSQYISALAISDTLGLLIAFIHYLNQVPEVAMPLNQFRHCNVVFVFVVFTFLCSTYFIIAMTFERFYSIIRPHKAASFNTVKRARIIITCIVICSVFYSIPYFFTSGNFGTICIPNRFASDNIYGEMFHWITQFFYFLVPFLSLLTMNSVIIHTLRKRSNLNLSISTGQGETEGQYFKTKNPEKQIFITVLLITFVFLILNTPALAVVIYLTFYTGNTNYYHAGLHLFFQISDKTYVTNHGINFFLYVISGQKFRRDLRNLFITKRSNNNNNTNILESTSRTLSSTISSVAK